MSEHIYRPSKHLISTGAIPEDVKKTKTSKNKGLDPKNFQYIYLNPLNKKSLESVLGIQMSRYGPCSHERFNRGHQTAICH